MTDKIEDLEKELAKLRALVAKEKEADDNSDAVAALKKSLNALDKKYKEALKEKKAAEKAAREVEIAALKKEGKELEALQKEMESTQAELELLREENVALKRDQVLDSVLNGREFKSERSRRLARKDIVDQLVKNEDGSWSSKDGKSIEDYASEYFEDEENRTLFLKAKVNTGASTGKEKGEMVSSDKVSSIFDIPQEQLIKQVKRKLNR
jgi:hypothetical protein